MLLLITTWLYVAMLPCRAGGADLNPQELVAEGVLEHFLPLHVPRQLYRFNAFWAKLPESLTQYAGSRVTCRARKPRRDNDVTTPVPLACDCPGQARKRRRCGAAQSPAAADKGGAPVVNRPTFGQWPRQLPRTHGASSGRERGGQELVD